MKTALILASMVLVANYAYAEKAPHQPRAKATPQVNRTKQPATNANIEKPTNPGNASRENTLGMEEVGFVKGTAATPGSVPARKMRGDPTRNRNTANGTGANAARTANPMQTQPTNTPDGFQALTKNEKIKASAQTPSADRNQPGIKEPSTAAPAIQQKMQNENRN